MAYENFPTAENTPKAAPPKQRNDSWKGLTIGALAVALAGTWGYLIYDKNNNKQAIQQKETLIASTTSERDNLQKELEDAELKFDQLKSSSAGELAKKDAAISEKDKEINAKKERIRQLLAKENATKGELAEARRLISSLNSDIATYKTQVEELTLQNQQLVAEKTEITRQRDEVQKSYEEAKTTVKQKEETIDVGTTLHASEFNIIPINEKKGGKEKRSDNVNKVDLLRVYFNLGANRITPTGNKEIYVCITGPDGTPLAVQAAGSGKFTTKEDGEKVFTKKLEVDYEQGKVKGVNFDWKQESKFAAGEYKIEVYQNGFKIGQGVRSLRKGGLFS